MANNIDRKESSMKHSDERRKTINTYILEKISEKAPGLYQSVADTFGISTNTVNTYISKLVEEGIVKKHKRGEYELVSLEKDFTFSRSKGELEIDTYPYDVCVADRLEEFSDNIRHIWLYSMSEMVNNVIDHSGAKNMHVHVKSNYLTTAVTITDDGVGIFEKLKNYFSLPSLDEAICELFKGKLTTDRANHSGEGIFFTSKMMDNFSITSGGKIFTTNKYDSEELREVISPPNGTTVFMELSNFTNKSTKEIFDAYSDPEGAFTTTRIPLKNIFDTAPVSRSQAKRVCNRLDEFEEVILDFHGISWMGQGFAHQIFVVYANAHPGISITAENMCDSVLSMYKHVINSV